MSRIPNAEEKKKKRGILYDVFKNALRVITGDRNKNKTFVRKNKFSSWFGGMERLDREILAKILCGVKVVFSGRDKERVESVRYPCL